VDIINPNVQLTFGAPQSPFGVENAVLLTTTQSVVLSQGVWMVQTADVNTALQYSPNLGTTWRTLVQGVAAGRGAIVYSDGFSVRLNQATAVAATTTFYTQVKALF